MTCDNQSYLVIFSDSGSSEVPMKRCEKQGKVNNLNSKNSNIFRIFKLDLSHFSLLLTEPKTNPKGWILKKAGLFETTPF